MSTIRFGASSFTAPGWEKTFYPAGLRQQDYLAYYASQFDTLEIDSTFYASPRPQVVRNWRDKVPSGFLFALKVPQIITHERCMEGCEGIMSDFFETAELLGDKLGSVLLQFPYLSHKLVSSGEDFIRRLDTFLAALPLERRRKLAVEVRNREFITPELYDYLRSREVAFTLVDLPRMPRPQEFLRAGNPLTSTFAYVRLLGDRHAMEKRTQSWHEEVQDRATELDDWINACKVVRQRGVDVLVYVNNHYAGHAPATIRKLRELWEKSSGEKLPVPAPVALKLTAKAPKKAGKELPEAAEPTLFDSQE